MARSSGRGCLTPQCRSTGASAGPWRAVTSTSRWLRSGIFPGPFAVGRETVAEVIAVGDEVIDQRSRRSGARAVSGLMRNVRGLSGRPLRGVSHLSRTSRRRVRIRRGGWRPRRGGGGCPRRPGCRPHAACGSTRKRRGTVRSPPTTPAMPIAPSVRNSPSAQAPKMLIVGRGSGRPSACTRSRSRADLAQRGCTTSTATRARCAAAAAIGADVEHQHGPWPRRFERAPITVEATGELEVCTRSCARPTTTGSARRSRSTSRRPRRYRSWRCIRGASRSTYRAPIRAAYCPPCSNCSQTVASTRSRYRPRSCPGTKPTRRGSNLRRNSCSNARECSTRVRQRQHVFSVALDESRADAFDPASSASERGRSAAIDSSVLL